jgi:putative membrane protein
MKGFFFMKSFNGLPKFIQTFGCGIIAAAVMVTQAAQAAESDSPNAPTSKGAGASHLSGNDVAVSGDSSAFIKQALEGNSAEIALAEVAQRKAQSSDVKQFAEMLRTDHTKANQQLQPIAQAHNVTVNQSLDSKHQKKLEHFQQMSGTQFDKEYVKDMLRDHQKDISLYEQASQQIQDSDLKQYVQSTLPKLQQHMEHAKQTAQSIGIDQATISSLTKGTGSMGGAGDSWEKGSGSGQHDKQQ